MTATGTPGQPATPSPAGTRSFARGGALEATSSGPCLLPAASLAWRELIRFVRQPHRVVGALGTPLVFWLLIGAGMGRSFRAGDGADTSSAGYIEYFYPGTILMVLLFTSIFSTISIIEDRREGFLQSVLVAPVSRMAIVLGKALGGTALASVQGFLFLALAPLLGVRFDLVSLGMCGGLIVLNSFALTCLGICIAWRLNSTQGFHAIMNLFLMPMWFLSGALFPASGAWGPMWWLMILNPLTYGLAALRRALYWNAGDGFTQAGAGAPGLAVSVVVLLAFAALLFVAASLVARRTLPADLH